MPGAQKIDGTTVNQYSPLTVYREVKWIEFINFVQNNWEMNNNAFKISLTYIHANALPDASL